MKEFWKPIKGFKYYEASNLGRIRSINRVLYVKTRWGTKTKRKLNGKILANPKVTNSAGYYGVSLGSGCKKMLHRVIAETFVPNPKKLPCVDHIDGDTRNNTATNLRWCTYSENVMYSRLNGSRGKTKTLKQIERFLCDCQHEEFSSHHVVKIGKRHGLKRHAARMIAQGKLWKSHQYPSLKKIRTNLGRYKASKGRPKATGQIRV